MTLWNLNNPSDPITFVTGSHLVAAVVCILLGKGQYSAEAVGDDDDRTVPLFMFGGQEELNAWAKETLNVDWMNLPKHLDNPEFRGQLADALHSMAATTPENRQQYDQALNQTSSPEERQAKREEWHQEHVSSINAIALQAWRLAAELRKNIPEEA